MAAAAECHVTIVFIVVECDPIQTINCLFAHFLAANVFDTFTIPIKAVLALN
jgi:hypothetical protein